LRQKHHFLTINRRKLEIISQKWKLIPRKGFSSFLDSVVYPWVNTKSLEKYIQGKSCYFEAKTSLFDEKSPKIGNYVTEIETNCKKRFLFISWLFSISLSKYQQVRKIYLGEGKLLFWGKNVTFWRKIAENGKLCHRNGN
jgi:hypothetical protein